MKKARAFLLLIFLVIGIFIIQIGVLNKMQLFGIIPNLLLVTVVMISLWYDVYLAIGISATIGLIADIFFTLSIGKYLIIYLVISIVISTISRLYRKDNNTVIMYVVAMGVIIFECAMFVVSLSNSGNIIGFWQMLFLIFKSTLLNIGLAYIINRVLKKYTIRINKNLNISLER